MSLAGAHVRLFSMDLLIVVPLLLDGWWPVGKNRSDTIGANSVASGSRKNLFMTILGC